MRGNHIGDFFLQQILVNLIVENIKLILSI